MGVSGDSGGRKIKEDGDNRVIRIHLFTYMELSKNIKRKETNKQKVRFPKHSNQYTSNLIVNYSKSPTCLKKKSNN